jgi:hypothetical protein
MALLPCAASFPAAAQSSALALPGAFPLPLPLPFPLPPGPDPISGHRSPHRHPIPLPPVPPLPLPPGHFPGAPASLPGAGVPAFAALAASGMLARLLRRRGRRDHHG